MTFCGYNTGVEDKSIPDKAVRTGVTESKKLSFPPPLLFLGMSSSSKKFGGGYTTGAGAGACCTGTGAEGAATFLGSYLGGILLWLLLVGAANPPPVEGAAGALYCGAGGTY